MVWSEAKVYVMLKEVAAEGVFDSKPGSRERSTSWQKVANKLYYMTSSASGQDDPNRAM